MVEAWHPSGEWAAMATAVLWTMSALAWTTAGRHAGALAVSFLRLVLAVPMLAITKIICDDIPPLRALGHFLET